MEARVKSSHRWNTVNAFSGLEFVKGAWRQVPSGLEDAAQAHPFLETNAKEPPVKKQVPVEEETAAEAPEAEAPSETNPSAKKAKASKK